METGTSLVVIVVLLFVGFGASMVYLVKQIASAFPLLPEATAVLVGILCLHLLQRLDVRIVKPWEEEVVVVVVVDHRLIIVPPRGCVIDWCSQW